MIRDAIPMPEALAEVRRAVQDDPLNAWVGGMHSYLLGIAGMHDESIAEAERSFRLDEDSFFAHWDLMRAHAWGGHYDRALEVAPGLLRDSGRNHWALGLLAWTHAQAGHADQARAVYDEMEGVAPRVRIAILAGGRGPFRPARGAGDSMVERRGSRRDPLVAWAQLPFWSSIRADPRFKEIMPGVAG